MTRRRGQRLAAVAAAIVGPGIAGSAGALTISLRVGFADLGGRILGQASSSSGLKTQASRRAALDSTRAWDFDICDGYQTVSSDFPGVAIHEIGHVLGVTSAVASNSSNNATPADTDRFRCEDGALGFTWGGTPYFSIDGGASRIFGRSGSASGFDGLQTSQWKEGLRIHDGVSCTQLVEPPIGITRQLGAAGRRTGPGGHARAARRVERQRRLTCAGAPRPRRST